MFMQVLPTYTVSWCNTGDGRDEASLTTQSADAVVSLVSTILVDGNATDIHVKKKL